MSKRVIFLFLGISALTAWLALGHSRRSAPPAEPLPAPHAASAVASNLPAARIRAIFQSPRGELKAPGHDTLSPACQTYWNGLRQLDLASLHSPTQAPAPLPDGKLCDGLPAVVALEDARYRAACAGFAKKVDAPTAEAAKEKEKCLTALFLYRARITDWMTRQLSAAEISDPKVLTDKVFARFADDPAAAADFAERLLEVEPEMVPAAKAAMISRLMDAQAHAAGNPSDERWSKLDRLFDRAEKMSPDDAGEIVENRLAVEMMRNKEPDLDRVRNVGTDLNARQPNSGEGPYLMALSEFKTGRPNEALRHLQEAERREPGNSRYRETAERIQKGDGRAFRMSSSFSLDLSRYAGG